MYNYLTCFINKKFHIDAHYFIKGGFWLTATQIITVTLGVVTTALFAHFLSENEYGVYRYLISVAVLLSSLSLTGLGQSIIQAAAKKYESFYNATLKTNFIYSLTITAAGLVGFGYYWIKGNEILSFGCLLVAFLQPVTTVYQNTTALLQGSQRFKALTLLNTCRSLLSACISIVVLLFTKNILLLFLTYLLVNLFINVLSHLLFKPRKTELPDEVFAKYLAYAKHTSVRNIISNVAQRADAIIIFTQLGAVQLALYTIVLVIPEQIKGSVKNFAALLLPKYAKYKNHSHILHSIPRRSLQLFLILIVVTIIYIVAAPFVYQILFPKYPSAVFLSQLLALSFPAMISILPVSFLQSQLKEKELYKSQTLEAVVTVMSSFVLTLQFGVIGAITAKVATRYLISIYYFVLIHRKSINEH